MVFYYLLNSFIIYPLLLCEFVQTAKVITSTSSIILFPEDCAECRDPVLGLEHEQIRNAIERGAPTPANRSRRETFRSCGHQWSHVGVGEHELIDLSRLAAPTVNYFR